MDQKALEGLTPGCAMIHNEAAAIVI